MNAEEIYKAWGKTLSEARVRNNQGYSTLSRVLMLSLAQLKGIENGDTRPFHALPYYLRGVSRYANHLGITLEPSPESMLEASRAQTRRVYPNIAANQQKKLGSIADGNLALPKSRSHGSRTGAWLLSLLLLLGAAGLYAALSEGWPTKTSESNKEPETLALAAPETAEYSPPESVANQETQVPEASTGQESIAQSQSDVQPEVIEAASDPASAPGPATASADSTATSDSALTTAQVSTTNTAVLPTNVTSPTTAEQPQSQAQNPVQASEQPQVVLPASSDSVQPISVDAGQPTSAKTVNSTVQAVASKDIVLSFTEDCWTEWQLQDGQSQQKIFKPGEELQLPLEHTQRLVLGNAHGVVAQYAGKPLDIRQFLKGSRSVVRLDEAMLRQAIQAQD